MNTEQEDMSVSPILDTRFQPGVSGNPNGRPKGSGAKRPKSKMRGQLDQMCKLQPDALEIVRQQMTGKDSDGNIVPQPSKEKVDIAKYILNKIESINNSCLREELAILGVQKNDKEGAAMLEENQQQTEVATASGLFSMDLPTPTQH